MSSAGSNVSGINLELFKRLNIYQIVGRKLFGCNVYRLAWTAANAITGCVVALTAVGLLVQWHDYVGIGDLALVQLLFFYLIYSLYLLKCVTLVRRGDDLWWLIDVTRERFMVSDRCRKHVAMFHEQRARSITATYALCNFGFAVTSQWLAFPLLVNGSSRADGATACRGNVFHLPFPVATRRYNDYYALFYAAELIITVCITYVQVLFDAFIISLYYVFVVDYDIVARSTGNRPRNECRPGSPTDISRVCAPSFRYRPRARTNR
jgi:hypothetical protein